jgi:3-hydroxyisobutyrate dehydrogenase
MIKKICIVGYGTITKNIIKNIKNNSDIFISVWSRTKNFNEKQIECSNNIEELIKDVDLILSCVPDDKASDEVWQNQVVTDYIRKNQIYCVEMSTLSHKYITSWHSFISGLGGRTIESPFTKNRAIHSDKSISAFLFTKHWSNEVEEFMNTFCNKIYSFNSLGDPVKFKLIYNTWGAEMLCQFREMYSVVENEIETKDVAWNILSNDGWMSLVCSGILPEVKSVDSTVGFKLKYMKKDVNYSQDMFKDSENVLYHMIQKKLDNFVNEENENKDFSLIVKNK